MTESVEVKKDEEWDESETTELTIEEAKLQTHCTMSSFKFNNHNSQHSIHHSQRNSKQPRNE